MDQFYHIPLQWTRLFYSALNINQPVAELLHKYQEVFQTRLAHTQGEVSIQINPKVMPKFCKPQLLPFAMKGKVEDELKSYKSKG